MSITRTHLPGGIMFRRLARSSPVRACWCSCSALLKPRVMSLVVFTAVAGMALAPGHLHVAIAFAALLCIAVGAGASGALNMAYDADIDLLMSRTVGRPIPQGHVTQGAATGFGIV